MAIKHLPKEVLQQFCTFRIEGQLYGIDIKYIKEINTETKITSVPHSPEYISGLVNIRGEIYLVFNLRKCLGFPAIPIDENHRIILFKSIDTEPAGVFVDQIADVLTVPKNRLEPYHSESRIESVKIFGPLETSDVDTKLIQGVYQLDEEVMIILNVHGLIGT